MLSYSIRRIIAALPVLFGVLLVTFVLVRLIPGDPCTAQLGEKATPEICERFNREKGLDRPIFVQFGIYARDVLRGDLGQSIRFNRPVTQLIVERLPVTIELGVSALAIATIIGIPAGLIAAIRRNSAADVSTMVGANIGVSMPVFWLGLMLAYVFALLLKDTPFQLPPSGRLSSGIVATPFYEVYGWDIVPETVLGQLFQFAANFYLFNSVITWDWEVFRDALSHLILPACALATIPMAIIARMTRSSMLEVQGRDYIRTARAKGLVERRVVLGHALRNALLPVVTIVGLQLGTVFSGAVLTETIFNLAGVGKILFEAITARDYPIIQGFTLTVAIGYVTINLLVDLSYAWLDPRIRLS
ncbi:MAG: ABC transporter permease [Chloroflexales bacterium]|nr:ABC transporter permease [Chloroflexales bacterium]